MSGQIYLTGFEPFLAIRENPTQAIVQALHGQRFGDLTVTSRVLPVTWADTPRLLMEDRERIQPALCVHLGVSGQAQLIRLERLAYNTIRSNFEDNAGVHLEEQPIEPAHPIEASLETSLDLSALLNEVQTDEVPMELSEDPGRYLCNRAYYESLKSPETPSLFVHVPHTDNRDPSGERWTPERLMAGTRTILESLCRAV